MMDWPEEFPGYISVCDSEGKILVMNKRITDYFARSGGKALIGSSIFDCHNPNSAQMIRDQITSRKTIVYTHVENGVQEIILHVPWYQFGKFAGLVEISLPYDGEIEHH
jgi:hypothetical protein